MAMLARPVDPRLCQKLQCGVVGADELTSDVVADCYRMGYSGTKSPLADECRQYYPARCQSGPMRAFPDISDAWLRLGPSVADIAAAWPAMPEQAVSLPAPFRWGTVDSGGVAIVPKLGGDPGYPYVPGNLLPADQTFQPSTDTGLDQMASQLKWPWSVTPNYNTPAAPTPDAARYTTAPIGPGTFLPPLPSITPTHGRVSGEDAAAILEGSNPACRFARWLDENKLLAVGALAVAFLAMTGGGRGR